MSSLSELTRDADAPVRGRKAYALLRLLRPKQWIKNGFVVAPLVFAGHYRDPAAIALAVAATALFSIAASAAYVVNDIADAASDRLHPVKRYTRPLAAGAVTVTEARIVVVLLWAIVAATVVVWPEVGVILAGYVAINLAYTAKLKHVPVVDLFCIAIGFVLRVWTGAAAISVPLSSWMLITTLCLALYLAAIKRRQELVVQGAAMRTVLGTYSAALLDRYAQMAAVGAILFYSLYVVEIRPELVITVPLVLFGIFRYWFIAEARGAGESPTDAIYSDPSLIVTVVAWGALSVYALWPT